MDLLSFIFIAIAVFVVGSAWLRLRSNWRSVQAIRAGQKAPLDDAGVDPPEFVDGAHLHGHGQGHDCAHHSGDAGGHDFGDFHGGDHGGFDGGGGHH